MRINTNVASINAQRNLWSTQQEQSRSMDKLSSGFRINRAADDAAGLGIANKLRADNRSLQQSFRNAEQGNAMLQIAEGSTSTIQKMLERMKELATQAASDNVDDDNGRARLDTEFTELTAEIDRIVNSTKYQGQALLDGNFGVSGSAGALTFQIGSENDGDNRIEIELESLSTSTLGLSGAALTDRSSAQSAMSNLDTALDTLNEYLGNIGAYQNRLEYTMANLKTSIQNNSAAESVIRDLDMAEEMTKFSKLGILSQAGQAMLAQANQSTQGVLQLLRG